MRKALREGRFIKHWLLCPSSLLFRNLCLHHGISQFGEFLNVDKKSSQQCQIKGACSKDRGVHLRRKYCSIYSSIFVSDIDYIKWLVVSP